MSAKWSVQPFKGTIADADVFLIIDSEAGPVENKQVLFSTLALATQTPWRGDIDAATFNLDNLTSVDLNNAIGPNPTISALQSAIESTLILGSNFQVSSGYIDIAEITTPTNPAADVGRLYVKDDGGITNLFFRDSAGTETDLVSGGGGGHVIEDEGTPLTQRAALNFVGAGVVVTDDLGNDASVVTIPGGGGGSPLTTQGDIFGRNLTVDARIPIGSPGQALFVNTAIDTNVEWQTLPSSYQSIQDEGVGLNLQNTLNFIGAGVVAVDNAGQNRTDVTIAGGGGSSPTTVLGDMIARGVAVDERVPIGTPGQVLTMSTIPTNLVFWNTLPINYNIVQDEGIAQVQRNIIDFVGLGVTVTDVASKTTVTIPGGADVLTTKGDILTFDTAPNRLPVGLDNQILTADSAEALGVKWAAGGLGHVIESEGTPLIQRSVMNFTGNGVLALDTAGETEIRVGGFTGQNVGTGLGEVFKTVVPTNFVQFRSLLAGTNILITNNTDDITFDVANIYSTIQDEGIALAQEDTLDFIGAGVIVTPGVGKTTVNISGAASVLTTQGDILGRNLTVDDRLPIGTPGQVLRVTTISPTLLQWFTLPTFYRQIQEEGVSLAEEQTMNFIGAGVTATAGTFKTDITIPGTDVTLTTQGDILGRNLTVNERLPIGSPGQILTVNTAVATNLAWTTPDGSGYDSIEDEAIPVLTRTTINFVGAGVTATDDVPNVRTNVTIPGFTSPLTTQGDIFGRNLTVDDRIPIGSPGQVLTVQTAQPTQVGWVTPAPASPVSVIGHVDVVTPTNSISIVLTETINFDDTVTDIELVGSFSLAVADTVRYTINLLSQTAYSSTFVFVSNTGVVTGQNTANASVGWSTGKSFAAGLSAAIKLRLNIGDSISLNSRPTGEIWETPGDTTGDLYRAGRVNYVATPAPTSITSIQLVTAGLQNFEAGSSFTVIKRKTT